MGIENRDYIRLDYESHRISPLAGVRFWSVTTWLIVINVAVFLLNNLIVQTVASDDGYYVFRTHPIESIGHFSVTSAVYHLEVWRFITFQFLHADLGHIFFNMLALYFFGQLVESYLSPRRYLAFYLLCGIAGPLMYMALWEAGLLIHSPDTPLVGASAGIFGVLVAASFIAPNATVLVMGVIPAQLRVVAWCAGVCGLYGALCRTKCGRGSSAYRGRDRRGGIVSKPAGFAYF